MEDGNVGDGSVENGRMEDGGMEDGRIEDGRMEEDNGKGRRAEKDEARGRWEPHARFGDRVAGRNGYAISLWYSCSDLTLGSPLRRAAMAFAEATAAGNVVM
jgi:hypothetical protein